MKQTEEEARHAAEEFPQPGALQGLPRAEYEAAYAAQTTYREAQLRRLGKARALGAAERELYKARKEHHERSARRAKELSRIEAARKSFVAECEQKGLKGYTKGWWVVNDTQPAPAPEPPAAFQWA